MGQRPGSYGIVSGDRPNRVFRETFVSESGDSVRYVASGAGRFFLGFRAPAPDPTHSPDRPPVKLGGEKRGPVQGMSGDSPRTGEGAGLP